MKKSPLKASPSTSAKKPLTFPKTFAKISQKLIHAMEQRNVAQEKLTEALQYNVKMAINYLNEIEKEINFLQQIPFSPDNALLVQQHCTYLAKHLRATKYEDHLHPLEFVSTIGPKAPQAFLAYFTYLLIADCRRVNKMWKLDNDTIYGYLSDIEYADQSKLIEVIPVKLKALTSMIPLLKDEVEHGLHTAFTDMLAEYEAAGIDADVPQKVGKSKKKS